MKTTYCSPRLSYETPDCSMPLTFDTYSYCSYKCLYCFAWMEKAKGIQLRQEKIRHKIGGSEVNKVSFDKIKKLFSGQSKAKQSKLFYEHFIKNKKEMQWGGLTEPFDFIEE